MTYEPLHHKYRPQTFAELVGQEAIAATLSNALRQQKIAPAYLFTGARGTGKTSSARIFAKSLNCLTSEVPTDRPCGKCEVCRAIANGSALDVIEIDAASNTGVDNIRELIERSQFAPVQCRYKVYVVDECLTGDSLVLTDRGVMRIDDPTIKERQVLSYNETADQWEWKQVLNWFDQGERETLIIQTTHHKIRCTKNHLIRTDRGWVPAGELKLGMKILAPQALPNDSLLPRSKNSNQFAHTVPAAVENCSLSRKPISGIVPASKPSVSTGANIRTRKIIAFAPEQLAGKPSYSNWKLQGRSAPADVVSDWTFPRSLEKPAWPTSNAIGRSIQPGKTTTNSLLSLNEWLPWRLFAQSVLVDVESCWKFPHISSANPLLPLLPAFKATGNATPIDGDTAFGTPGLRNFWQRLKNWTQSFWDLFTAHCWETVRSPIPTPTADFPVWHLAMPRGSEHGLNTKLNACQNYDLQPGKLPTLAMEKERWRSTATLPVIHNFAKSLQWLSLTTSKRLYHGTGSIALRQKDWPGGTWMTAHSATLKAEVQEYKCIPKDSRTTKTRSSLIGWVNSDTPAESSLLPEARKDIPALHWEPQPLENGWQTLESLRSLQWITSLETVESIYPGTLERVYDIEVEDNHNFVANGLSFHNCHMLSTAAFNALLKTLEEPPPQVVFVLATTDPQRVLPTIISRCQRFDFRRIPLEAMVVHLGAIATQETIPIAPEALQLVAQISQGGLRDAESLLDQLSLLEGDITTERVWDLVGAVPEQELLELLRAIAQNNAEAVLDRVRQLMDRGREPLTVLQNLGGFYRDLLIAKTAPTRNDLVSITPPTWKQVCEFVQTFEISWILEGQKQLRTSEVQIKNTTQPRLWLEVTLLGLLPSAISSQVMVQPLSASVASTLSPAAAPERGKAVPPPPAPTPAARPEVPPAVTTSPPAASRPEASPPATSVSPAAVPPESVLPVAPPAPAMSPPPTPTPVPVAAAASGEANLEQIWQEVLSGIKPPSTQMLLRQQGRLLYADQAEVRIGVTAQWYKTAQGKLSSLVNAFREVLGQSVNVKLEVWNPPTPQTKTPEAQPGADAEAPGTTPPVQLREPRYTPPPPEAAPPAGNVTAPGNAVEQAPAVNRSVSPPVERAVPPSPAIAPLAQPAVPSASWEEDEVLRAARSLAQMFNGKIVNLSEAEEAGKVSEGASSLPVDDPDGDDDVPF